MASFGAVVVIGPIPKDFYDRAASAGVRPLREGIPSGNLWIETPGLSFDADAQLVAERMSAIVSGTAFALVGQSVVDGYIVAEFERGSLVRKLTYIRDEGGWAPTTGTHRPWEVDYHFALDLEAFASSMLDVWSEQEIRVAREAYEARDLSKLPRLPDATYMQLVEFAKQLGFDPESGSHARYKRPGILARLIGR